MNQPFKIAIFAPIYNSPYSRLVTHLAAQEPGIEVVQIIVLRMLNWKRISGELRRDGVRLLKKVHAKLVLGADTFYAANDFETIADLMQSANLPGKNLHQLAGHHNIPILFTNNHNDPKVVSALQAAHIDAIAFTGGGLIRKDILEVSRLGVLNCHAGLLPKYRGMDVVEWPLLDDHQTGLTLHFMDKGVDTGPILKTHPLPFKENETVTQFRKRIEPEMVRLILTGLRELRDGTLQPQPQAKTDGKQYFVMHPRLKAKIKEL